MSMMIQTIRQITILQKIQTNEKQMINIIDGNILNSKADLILHQVNCCGKINSGVAKTLRNFNEGIL